jgi:GNAT superfamily N-acetyltransferase
MPSQFSTTPIELGRASIVALDPRHSERLAAAIVAMPPWSVMNYPADAMARFLAAVNGCVSRYAVEIDGTQMGAVSVRTPWLKGPYLELLALLPTAQGRGIGSAILGWFERQALQHGARNLWVCASSFNTRALRFYERHGFEQAVSLPGLVVDGYDEILLRKFPLGGGDDRG